MTNRFAKCSGCNWETFFKLLNGELASFNNCLIGVDKSLVSILLPVAISFGVLSSLYFSVTNWLYNFSSTYFISLDADVDTLQLWHL